MMIHYMSQEASMRANHFVCVLTTAESRANIWPITFKPLLASAVDRSKVVPLVLFEPQHKSSNIVVCATSKASDQNAHSDQSLCYSLEYSTGIKLQTKHHLELLSLNKRAKWPLIAHPSFV